MVAPSTSHTGGGGGGGVERKQSILPLFPLLASHDESTRLSASYNLLSSLPLNPLKPNDTDLEYSLKRLLAGLTSSNESARQGFAVALTQLLSQLKESPQEIRQVLIKFEQATNGNKNGLDHREERDLFFAKLVGSHAIIRSGILYKQQDGGGEDWKEIVGGLVSLGNKKTWLKEPTTWVICQAIQDLAQLPATEEESDWKRDCLNWAVQRLVNDSREKAKGWGPDKLSIVLTLKSNNVVSHLSLFSLLTSMYSLLTLLHSRDGVFIGNGLQITFISNFHFRFITLSFLLTIPRSSFERCFTIFRKPFRIFYK